MVKRFHVYLSSTLADLKVERESVLKVLADEGVSVKQSYNASENDLVTTCLEDVGNCAVYVGIIGQRYGHRPGAARNPGNLSITELEFIAARNANMPRFVFMKSDTAKGYARDDFDTGLPQPGAGQAIADFRSRLGSSEGIVALQFDDTHQLEKKVLAKLADFWRHINGTLPIMQPGRKSLAELTHGIGLVLVSGTDQALIETIRPLCADSRFKVIELGLDEPGYAQRLDDAARACRTVCWVLTPASCQRLLGNPGLLQAATRAQRLRRGKVFSLLVQGLAPAVFAPDPGWQFDAAVRPAAGSNATTLLDELYVAVRAALPSIRPDRRIGIPCLMLAMNQAEAQEIADNTEAVMKRFAIQADQRLWKQQFGALRKAIRRLHEQWPEGFYGPQREDWRPFGPGQPRLSELLGATVERINDDSQRSSRERHLLAGEDVKLQLLHYSLDEYLNDNDGSRANLSAMLDRGCLVLVDETALLQPALRQAADALLKGQRVAVMSVHPLDPAPMAMGELLSDTSFRRVGSLRERFRDDHDPRCELAVNSVARLQRWLRLVLPELVPALGQLEPQPELRKRSSGELLGQPGPSGGAT